MCSKKELGKKELKRMADQLLHQNGYDERGIEKTPETEKQKKWERKHIRTSQKTVERSNIFYIPQIEEIVEGIAI